MATLTEWFETKDYELGLVFLARHSKNRVLIMNLSRKRNPAKLEHELTKIANHENLSNVPVPEVVKPESHSDQLITVMNNDRENQIAKTAGLKIIRNKHAVNYEDLPEHLQQLWDENRDAAKEMRVLHEKLKLMEKASPEDREPLTVRISQLDEKVHQNWEIINKWEPGKDQGQESDKDPSAPAKKEIDHKRINANRKYISTGLKMLKGDIPANKSEKIKNQILVRYNELISSAEEVTADTIEQIKKAGINI